MDNENPFGTIEAPAAIEKYGELGGSGPGLTGLLSNIMVMVIIIGGIWALFNIMSFGFEVISSGGDAKKLTEAGTKLTNTFMGILIMVAAPLLAAMIGQFFFGDPMYILNPVLPTPIGG